MDIFFCSCSFVNEEISQFQICYQIYQLFISFFFNINIQHLQCNLKYILVNLLKVFEVQQHSPYIYFILNPQILKVINKLYEFYFLNSVHLYYPIEHLIQVQMLIFSLSHTHQVIQSKCLLNILLIQHIQTKSLLQMFLSENHSSDHFRLIIEES